MLPCQNIHGKPIVYSIFSQQTFRGFLGYTRPTSELTHDKTAILLAIRVLQVRHTRVLPAVGRSSPTPAALRGLIWMFGILRCGRMRGDMVKDAGMESTPEETEKEWVVRRQTRAIERRVALIPNGRVNLTEVMRARVGVCGSEQRDERERKDQENIGIFRHDSKRW